MPCRTLQVTVSGKNYKKHSSNETALIYLYYSQRTPLSKEHYFYLFLSLLAEIGGYVGLLLGYSLFNVAGVMNTCINAKIQSMEEKERLDKERTQMVIARWDKREDKDATKP